MMLPSSDLVIDANVALSTVLDQPLSNKATVLLEFIISGRHVAHVPELFFAEIAHVLALHVKHPKIKMDQVEALESLQDLVSLPLTVKTCRQLAGASAKIACEYKVSGYDAMYVALSELIGAPLVTGDKKLINSLAQTKYKIIWLGDAV